MLVNNQKVIVKWNAKSKAYYESKGYKYTKMKDEFEVNIEDLPLANKSNVKVQCDYCNCVFEKRYQNYINERNKSLTKKDCCKDCSYLKQKDTNILKYGVEHPLKLDKFKEKQKRTNLQKYGYEQILSCPSVREKGKQTMINKYGVDNPLKSQEILEKVKSTNLKKYGVEWVSQSDTIKDKIKNTSIKKYGCEYAIASKEVREKIMETNMLRYGDKSCLSNKDIIEKRINNLYNNYGVINVFQLEEVKNKIKNTCIKRYGVSNPMQFDKIKNKSIKARIKTMCESGNVPTSKQQKHIHTLINGELNYNVGRCFLDIAFPEEMIYVEYNGGGHNLGVKTGRITEEEFFKKEMSRYRFLQKNGWKLIKIECPYDRLPSNEEIIKQINKAKEDLKLNNWIELNWN